MTIGERIKAARKAAGLTQKELGEKLGLSFQAVAQWENDLRHPKIDTLHKISNALDLPDFAFFSDDTNLLSPDLQERVLQSMQKRLTHILPESDAADDGNACGSIDTEVDWGDFFEGPGPLTLARAETAAKEMGVTLSFLLGEVNKLNAEQSSDPPYPEDNLKSSQLRSRMNDAFSLLNEAGQHFASNSVVIMAGNPDYQRHPENSPQQAQEGHEAENKVDTEEE